MISPLSPVVTCDRRQALELLREGKLVAFVCSTGRLAPSKSRATKVMCLDRDALLAWARANGIPKSWLHISRKGMPHFDLWGGMAGKALRQATRSTAQRCTACAQVVCPPKP